MQGAWKVVEPSRRFVPNWHIDVICEHLEAATRGEVDRLIINVPPGHMKSLSAAVFWPMWVWTSRPDARWVFASHSLRFSTRDSLKCRRLADSEWYRDRWGSTFALTTDQNVKTHFENDKTGYRFASSVGGDITGWRADFIVVDDPIDIEDRNSEAIRATVNDWQDMTVSSRWLPDTVQVLIMQRVHEDDLSGHLLEQGGWTHLCLPAEYEPLHPFVWPDDPRSEPGELLWPDFFTEKSVTKAKETFGSVGAAGLLQQRPTPAEGGLLKIAWWRYFDPAHLEEWRLDPVFSLCASWDTALKAKTTSDYTVGTLWATRGADRFLLRRFRDRVGFPDALTAIETMAEWAERHFPRLPLTTVVENAATGPEIVASLRDRVQGILLSNVKGDKETRAHAIAPQLEAGNVFVPGWALADGSGPDPARTPAWVQELIQECAGFPNGANDDQVDSVTQALIRLRGGYRRLPVDEPENGRARALSAGMLDRSF